MSRDPRQGGAVVQSITDVPLSIDSSIVKALEAGLAVYKGKPLVNSVTGEDEAGSDRAYRIRLAIARHHEIGGARTIFSPPRKRTSGLGRCRSRLILEMRRHGSRDIVSLRCDGAHQPTRSARHSPLNEFTSGLPL